MTDSPTPPRWAVELVEPHTGASQWQLYPEHVCVLLEATLDAPPGDMMTPVFEVPVFPAMHKYRISLADMEQINQQTLKRRRVAREANDGKLDELRARAAQAQAVE